MPVYMILIAYDPTTPSDGSPSRQPEHAQLTMEMRARGHYRSGAGLAPVERYVRRVRRVRQTAGRPQLLEGPFPETTEALGGYYVVECSEDEALEYASRVPVDNRSYIEVRQVGIYQPE